MIKELRNGAYIATLEVSTHDMQCNRYSIRKDGQSEVVVFIAGVRFNANINGSFFVNNIHYRELIELIGRCVQELKNINDKIVEDAFKD